MAGSDDLSLGSRLTYASFYAQHAMRRDLVFRAWDGSITCRRIVSSRSDGEGYELLTLDSSFGQIRKVSDWRQISFLTLSRLAADGVQINWATDDSITVDLSFVEVMQ